MHTISVESHYGSVSNGTIPQAAQLCRKLAKMGKGTHKVNVSVSVRKPRRGVCTRREFRIQPVAMLSLLNAWERGDV